MNTNLNKLLFTSARKMVRGAFGDMDFLSAGITDWSKQTIEIHCPRFSESPTNINLFPLNFSHISAMFHLQKELRRDPSIWLPIEEAIFNFSTLQLKQRRIRSQYFTRKCFLSSTSVGWEIKSMSFVWIRQDLSVFTFQVIVSFYANMKLLISQKRASSSRFLYLYNETIPLQPSTS